MNSDIFFQMLLYYHSYFDIIYGLMLIPSGLYKLGLGNTSIRTTVGFLLVILNVATEYLRLGFGYTGNINESFPDLMAFAIQTLLFSLPFAITPAYSKYKYPHEDCLYTINLIFLGLELLVGCYVMSYFS